MEDDWYVVQKGKPTGPYAFNDLKNIITHPGTFVKTSGMDDYKEAHEVPQLRKLLGFKKEVILPQYFATPDVRLLAFMIDLFIISIACAIPVILFVVFAEDKLYKILASVSWFLILPFVKAMYGSVMESSARQGTYGKSWLGVRVCDEEGKPVREGRAFARNFAKIFSFITFGIGYMMGFFSRRQQCLHDRIAGTLVVKGRLV